MMDKSKLENKVDESSSGQQNLWRTETFKDKRLNKNPLNPQEFSPSKILAILQICTYMPHCITTTQISS